MVYLYSNKTKEITRYDRSVVVNTDEMINLETIHKEDIRNNYGKIVYNETTQKPEYKPNYVSIVVDKTNNNFSRVLVKGEDDENNYYTDVLFKDYVNNTSIDVYNKVSKFYNGKFYLFDKDKKMKYNPTNNTWNIDIEEYKKTIIEKISGAEEEIRHHGFYHNLLGEDKTFLQPFRNVNKDNDQTTLLALRYSSPQPVRKLKLFVEDETTGKRATAPKTFYWIMNGQVSDIVLDSISTLILAYSESVKAGMNYIIKKVKSTVNLEELKDIEKKYVQMILISMKQAIESNPANLALLNHNKDEIKKQNIQLIKDNNFVAGGDYNGDV